MLGGLYWEEGVRGMGEDCGLRDGDCVEESFN